MDMYIIKKIKQCIYQRLYLANQKHVKKFFPQQSYQVNYNYPRSVRKKPFLCDLVDVPNASLCWSAVPLPGICVTLRFVGCYICLGIFWRRRCKSGAEGAQVSQ